MIFETVSFFLGVLFESASQPPHPPRLCLGISDEKQHWNATGPRLCVCRWSRSRALLGGIHGSSGSSAPQLPLWLLLKGSQLLLVSLIYLPTIYWLLEICQAPGKGLYLQCFIQSPFSSLERFCAPGFQTEPNPTCGCQDCPTSAPGVHCCPVLKSLQDTPLKIMAFITVPTGSPNLM